MPSNTLNREEVQLLSSAPSAPNASETIARQQQTVPSRSLKPERLMEAVQQSFSVPLPQTQTASERPMVPSRSLKPTRITQASLETPTLPLTPTAPPLPIEPTAPPLPFHDIAGSLLLQPANQPITVDTLASPAPLVQHLESLSVTSTPSLYTHSVLNQDSTARKITHSGMEIVPPSNQGLSSLPSMETPTLPLTPTAPPLAIEPTLSPFPFEVTDQSSPLHHVAEPLHLEHTVPLSLSDASVQPLPLIQDLECLSMNSSLASPTSSAHNLNSGKADSVQSPMEDLPPSSLTLPSNEDRDAVSIPALSYIILPNGQRYYVWM